MTLHMRRSAIALTAGLAGIFLALPACAEVMSSDKGHFTVRETAHVKASAKHAWQVMTWPQDWWSADHTWSGDPTNMWLNARAGGCWCERLPNGGFSEHLRVIRSEPGKALVMRGALGPLQSLPLTGLMKWEVAENPDGGNTIIFTYQVSGNVDGGLESWAKPVDGVLAEAIARLAKAADKQPQQ